MGLHPQAKGYLDFVASQNLPPIEETQDLSGGRRQFNQACQQLCHYEDVFSVEDRVIDGDQAPITLRIYRPSEEQNLPVMVFFHGGGWVIGNVDSHDYMLRTFTNEAKCVVVSVDYSLAPEFKFPVPVEDCYLATQWVAKHAEELGVDSERLAIGGDSAGGNLAAVVAYLSVQRGGAPIHSQYLFYPSTGFVLTESYEQFGNGFGLDHSTMTWFTECYINDERDTQNPLAAPLLIPDEETAQLAPAYIVTAENDPLRDGGEQFAEKLKTAGVEASYMCYPGMIHGFMTMTKVLEDGNRAVREAAQHFRSKAITEKI